MSRLRSECIACVLDHQLRALPEDAPEDIKREYVQRMLGILSAAPKDMNTPILQEELLELRAEYFPVTDKYADIKRHFNAVMLGFEERMRNKISSAPDPLKAAIQCSMVGNFIDFGAKVDVQDEKLQELLYSFGSINVDAEELEHLKAELEKAGSLLLLADNCGEIVMDKLLLEEIERQYPQLEISVLVRGKPVSNDVTMDDAVQVGMTERWPVYGSGSSIAGTEPEYLSPEAKKVFDSADIILSKGQGNFESLHHCGLNVFFIFLCKCPMFAGLFGVEKFSGILAGDDKVRRTVFM